MHLGLFIHSHQPVGNFGWVFEENWERAYRPMLDALHRHPGVRVTLHYSGPLIDWLVENKPEFEAMVATLVERGQVEIAGGGYYEPILAMLPEKDRVGQLQLMRREVARRWGTAPEGAWLAERVWEPGLAASLADGGVAYTLVDDAHFQGAGLKEEELDGYYLTEEEGKVVAIFPGSQALRQHLPWKPVDEAIAWFRERAAAQPRLFVMGDDGEKFGAWPQTFEYCWDRENGWVERFFTALDESTSWLKTVKLGEWMRGHRAKGPIYLPTGTYQEMEEWSLPAETQAGRRTYRERAEEAGLPAMGLRPGFWRNYLVRYPEVAGMRHRIFRTRRLLDRAMPGTKAYREAQDLLWKGECNCPYWHGIFGGVYLHPLRVRTMTLLAEAEARAEKLAGEGESRVEDTDMDLREEIVLRTAQQRVVVDPAEGGAIVEWDALDPAWALLGVLARRPEAYHSELGPGESITPEAEGTTIRLPREVVYDTGRRVAMQERWLKPGATRKAWRSRAAEVALPLAEEWTGKLSGSATATCIGAIGPLAARKRVALRGEALEVAYTLTNPGRAVVRGTLVSEWNLTLPDEWGGPGRDKVTVGDGRLEVRAGGPLAVESRWGGFEAAWAMAVETVSSSERGLELTYQGVCVGFVAPLRLRPGEETRLRVRWKLHRPHAT